MYSAARAKKTSRESEIALLEKISTSLDTYIGDNPAPSPTPKAKYKRKLKPTETSQNAAKNFLAAKTLVKSIAKACAAENFVSTHEKADVLVESLVEEYRGKYPSVTKKMLLDGIRRHNSQNQAEEPPPAQEEDGDDYELKFGRIVPVVDLEMNRYHEKIEALKKAREAAAAEPEEKSPKRKKQKFKGEGSDHAEKQKAARAKLREETMTEEQKQEAFLMEEILKRYTIEREKHDRLPNGVLENIVEELKGEHELEHLDIPMKKIDKNVRRRYNQIVAESGKKAPSSNRAIVEEVYQRYSRTKEANGGKLPPGTMDAIIEGVKLEYGLSDVKLNSMKTKVRARFTKDNPDFPNCGGAVKIRELSEESKRRRQHLLNEITARYLREKEAHPKKLADGALDRIIENTKIELGITEFDVEKSSIRGRLHRKSFFVQTLGNDSPYDAVDEPLVATINGWLSQGVGVTRAQGLELANRLLKGKNLNKDSNGGEIVLDAKWWRNFLERNKRKLVCTGE